MNDRKAFFLKELKKPKRVPEPEAVLQHLCESTVVDDRIALYLKKLNEAKPDRIALYLKELKEAKQGTEPGVRLQEHCRRQLQEHCRRQLHADIKRYVLEASLKRNRARLWQGLCSRDREVEEQIISTKAEVTWYAPGQPRLFDVRVRKDNRKSFTVLQVVDPGRLIIVNEMSPFILGYEY